MTDTTSALDVRQSLALHLVADNDAWRSEAFCRGARAVRESVDERAKADAALAELRRQWPKRTPEDRVRARMIDASRERRPVPPLAPRKAS